MAELLHFFSTLMTADGVSVGLQGIIIFMMIWQQREMRHMQRDINHRMDAGFKRVDKRINRMDKRIDGLAVQVSESNRRVVMP